MFLDLPQVLQGESYSVGLCARAPNNTSLCIIIFTVSMVTVNLLSLKGMLAFNSIMGPNSTTILKNIIHKIVVFEGSPTSDWLNHFV